MTDLVIVKTGCANLASIIAACDRLGVCADVSDNAERITRASHLVLPGVGTFGAAMDYWRSNSLCEAIVQHISANKPLLAICLGLQLLCESSEEGPGVAGLGVIKQSVKRFSQKVRVPQMGWNFMSATRDCQYLTSGYAYFANSFYIDKPPENMPFADSSYGGDFVAAFEMGNLLACQFHPELSGTLGLSLIQNWLGAKSC